MTASVTTDLGSAVLSLGWVPVAGWRWADDLEFHPDGEGTNADRMREHWRSFLELLDRPQDEGNQSSVFAHRHGRGWLESRLAAVSEVAGTGTWLVPAGPSEIPARRVRIQGADTLSAFLRLPIKPHWTFDGEDDPRGAIGAFASSYGWLGHPQHLIPNSIPNPTTLGEPVRLWLEEFWRLRRLDDLLTECGRLERSTARLDLRATPPYGRLVELARLAGFTAKVTTGRVDELIRQVRMGVREILQPRLRGQFSVVLVDKDGPVKKFVPATLLAAMDLALVERTVRPEQAWGECPACGTQWPKGRANKKTCGTACRQVESRKRKSEAAKESA